MPKYRATTVFLILLFLAVNANAKKKSLQYAFVMVEYSCQTEDGQGRRIVVFSQTFGFCPLDNFYPVVYAEREQASIFHKAAVAACHGTLTSSAGAYSSVKPGYDESQMDSIRGQMYKLYSLQKNKYLVANTFMPYHFRQHVTHKVEVTWKTEPGAPPKLLSLGWVFRLSEGAPLPVTTRRPYVRRPLPSPDCAFMHERKMALMRVW